jgi:hypothetical protein
MVNVIHVSEMKNCELQSLAKEYGVDHYNFGHVEPNQDMKIDNSSLRL